MAKDAGTGVAGCWGCWVLDLEVWKSGNPEMSWCSQATSSAANVACEIFHPAAPPPTVFGVPFGSLKRDPTIRYDAQLFNRRSRWDASTQGGKIFPTFSSPALPCCTLHAAQKVKSSQVKSKDFQCLQIPRGPIVPAGPDICAYPNPCDIPVLFSRSLFIR